MVAYFLVQKRGKGEVMHPAPMISSPIKQKHFN